MSQTTLQDLSQHFRLRARLTQNEEILHALQTMAYPKAQNLTGMPSASGVRDKVGDLAAEIADMKERIRYLREEIEHKSVEIDHFIKQIESDQTRMIFRLRFIRCLTWAEVAAVIGGRNTEESVKSICYRYLST